MSRQSARFVKSNLEDISLIILSNHSNGKTDIYHSYLGLAALATMREPVLKEFDPALCISSQAKENINKLRKEALVPTKVNYKYGYSFPARED